MTLDAILARKRADVAAAQTLAPLGAVLSRVEPSARDFEGALRAARPAFVFEVKPRSPSEGILRAEDALDPVMAAYRRRADAVSVLTDEPFFGGSPALLARVRRMVPQPILAKDFVIDPYQVAALRLAGADAVLLILSVLDDPTYHAAAAMARSLRMGILTEVHTEAELARAVALGASVIGLNSRNLATLAVDLDATVRLASRAPADRVLIAESGIRTRRDVLRLGRHVDGFLIGTALMRAADPDRLARNLAIGPTKICGLSRVEEAVAAGDAGATHGGLVFAPSARQVNRPTAERVRVADSLDWVGVFAGEKPDRIAELARTLGLAAVQLHGGESDDHADAVRRLLPDGVELWRAVAVTDSIGGLGSPADRWVLDHGAGSNTMAGSPTVRGGTGRPFDWTLLGGIADPAACIVAGGLTAENVAAVPEVGIDFFDVSSGVETSPGRKDGPTIGRFLTARRSRAAQRAR